MDKDRYKGRLKALITAPGPVPWYFGPHRPDIYVGDKRWSWGNESKLNGFWHGVTLRDEASHIRLLCPMYSYVLQVDKETLVAWLKQDKTLQIAIINLRDLPPISNFELDKLLDDKPKGILWQGGGKSESVWLNSVLEEGTHLLDPRLEQLPCDELLILGGTPHTKDMAIRADQDGVAIFVLKPRLGQVEVIPQEWFNNDEHMDFDYQWITRVARDHESGRLVVDGIRLGAYVLAESGRRIEA